MDSTAIAKRQTAVCGIDERGVSYEIDELGDRSGYTFIFASGRYDGFSPVEVDTMLALTGRVAGDIENYHFANVMQLDHDYRAGRFASAFLSGKHGRAQGDNFQQGRGLEQWPSSRRRRLEGARMLEQHGDLRLGRLLIRLETERLIARCFGEGVALAIRRRDVAAVVQLHQGHHLEDSSLADNEIRDLAVEAVPYGPARSGGNLAIVREQGGEGHLRKDVIGGRDR